MTQTLTQRSQIKIDHRTKATANKRTCSNRNAKSAGVKIKFKYHACVLLPARVARPGISWRPATTQRAVQAHNLGLGNARRVHDAYVHTRHAGEHGVRDAYDTQQRGRARGPG